MINATIKYGTKDIAFNHIVSNNLKNAVIINFDDVKLLFNLPDHKNLMIDNRDEVEKKLFTYI